MTVAVGIIYDLCGMDCKDVEKSGLSRYCNNLGEDRRTAWEAFRE